MYFKLEIFMVIRLEVKTTTTPKKLPQVLLP